MPLAINRTGLISACIAFVAYAGCAVSPIDGLIPASVSVTPVSVSELFPVSKTTCPYAFPTVRRLRAGLRVMQKPNQHDYT